MEILSSFFGMIIRFIYELVNNNYFLSIVLFTLLTKIILLPLLFIQLKSMEKMQKIGPLDKQIKEKYKNDKQKQAEELTKIYSENKINPLGGCLPLLIQLPIILAMFGIVRQPLTYITQTPKEQIEAYTKEVLNKETVNDGDMSNSELIVAKSKGLIDMQVVKGINLGDVPADIFSKDPIKKAHPFSIIVPILTLVFSIIQNKLSQRNSSIGNEQAEMQKSMNLMLPLISAFVAYTMPLALGIYWLIGNVIQIIQQEIIYKVIRKEKSEKLALNKGGAINEKK